MSVSTVAKITTLINVNFLRLLSALNLPRRRNCASNARASGMPFRVTVEHYCYNDDGALDYDTQPEGMELDEGNYENYPEPE